MTSQHNLRQEFAIRAAELRASVSDYPDKVNLALFLNNTAAQLEAKQIVLDGMFKLFDERGIGAIYKNRSSAQYGFVLADASTDGAYRYQLFDEKGFFAHSTFVTAEEALLELCANGYVQLVPDETLDKMSETRLWKLSMEALALRTSVQEGRITYADAQRRYADLEMKYDPDLWVA